MLARAQEPLFSMQQVLVTPGASCRMYVWCVVLRVPPRVRFSSITKIHSLLFGPQVFSNGGNVRTFNSALTFWILFIFSHFQPVDLNFPYIFIFHIIG